MWPFKPSYEKGFKQGLTEMDAGNFKEACNQFSKVIEGQNDFKTDAHYNLARCFWERKYYGLAADHYHIFCNRQPEDVTPQLLEFIDVLRKADKLPPEEGECLFQDYRNRSIEQQSILKIGNRQISIDDFLDKVDDLIHEKFFKEKDLFDGIMKSIMKSFSAKVPMRVYGIPDLENSDPSDAFVFCEAFTLHGIAVAFIFLESIGKGPVILKKPPYEKSFGEADLSKRCLDKWLFIETALGQSIDMLANHFVSKKPWTVNSIDSIKAVLIKPFVYEGFSSGLESGSY